jgi:hypothetical protein
LPRGKLAHDSIGPERPEDGELPPAGGGRAPIGQVDDLALPRTIDGGVWLLDETRQPFGEPVIATRLA